MEQILLEDIQIKDKVVKASQQLTGIELNKLSEPTKNKLMQELSYLNNIVSQYSIKTFDDYRLISRSDLQKMVDALMRICQRLKKFSRSNYAVRRGN